MGAHDPSPLLERNEPLSALVDLVSGLARGAGHGRCMLLEGDAGVGKTSLLAAARAATADRADWWWGTCEPLLAPPALAPWFDMLPGLPPRLAETIRRGQVGADLYTGLLSVMRDAPRPLVVVVEDAHWADGASLDLLRFLARRVALTSALLVVSWRDAELAPDHPLRAVIAGLPAESTQRITLGPLSAAAVAEWAGRAGRDARGLFEATGGNPFFLGQLLASPRDASGGIPTAVRDALIVRVGRLPAPVREVLDLVSLSPVALEVDVLGRTCSPEPEDLAAAVHSGLLRHEAGGDVPGLRFVHELARMAVASALGPRAQALHALLFDALGQQHGVPVARRVHHAQHAGLAHAVMRLAPQAARAAALASAHRQAAALYALALRHVELLDAATEAALAEAHAAECLLTNEIDAAAESGRRALALAVRAADALAEGRHLRLLARIEWIRGRQPEGVALAARAISRLEAFAPDGREHAMACLTMGQLHLLADDPLVAARWVDRALPGLQAAGDLEGEVYALNTAGASRLLLGQDAGGLSMLHAALAKARDGGFEELAARAWANLASTALVQQRLDDAAALCRDGLAYCEARDVDVFAIHLQIRQALVLVQRGQWAEGVALLAALDARQDLNPLQRTHLRWQRAFMAVRRREPEAAAAWRAVAEDGPPLDPPPWYFDLTLMRVEAAWLGGEPAAALALAEAAWGRRSVRRDAWRRAELAVWLCRLGRPVEAEADWPAPPRLTLQGRHAEAAQAWATLGNPYEEALALADGDLPQNRAALQKLLAMGALAAARIVRARLRTGGARGVPRGSYGRARHDALGLTTRQREVLVGLRQGLSNREIALRLRRSERTVENHVAALIAKLGARDRHDAVRLACEN